MNLKEKLAQLHSEGRAILATNFYNFETLRAVANAALRREEPLILQLSESSIRYLGLEVAVAMARAVIRESGITAWLHLDHGKDEQLVAACMDAGFDSVMIDGSHLPFEANVELTARVVNMAAARNICVEGELGYVAKLGEEQRFEYTTPEAAERFARQTGVDALAVAIGSAHGFYRAEPRLAMEVLSAIRSVTPAALVLHGSSGIPHEQVRESIRRGISKVNLATEIKDLFMGRLKAILAGSDEIDLRVIFPDAIDSVTELVEQKMKMIHEA
jgi:ketose-bisphosphate aldolase